MAMTGCSYGNIQNGRPRDNHEQGRSKQKSCTEKREARNLGQRRSDVRGEERPGGNLRQRTTEARGQETP